MFPTRKRIMLLHLSDNVVVRAPLAPERN